MAFSAKQFDPQRQSTKAKSISHGEWEQKKATLEGLYVKQDMTVANVAKIMRESNQFMATLIES